MHRDFLTTLEARGFIHQCTDLPALAAQSHIIGYIGFDATAPSLHAGSLIPIMMLRHLQQCGHKPLIVLGGGTTKIGDPSGKDESRKLLTDEDIDYNIQGLKTVFAKYLSFEGSNAALMINNNDWLKDLNYVAFLRDYGKHFTINRMLSFDSVKLRLEREQPLTFLEFNYMIFQAYDFYHLNKYYDCTLQMGGSDQWGNIVNGVELIRRVSHKPSFGLTSPLLTTASGAKMGKTASGAVWLNEDLLSPYEYWQYWRNTEDQDVGKFLRLFTELPLAEIARLESLTDAEINEAKKILATEATALCHGRAAAEKAAQTAEATFSGPGISENLPSITVTQEALKTLTIIEALRLTALCQTNGEARRLIQNRGVKLNDNIIETEHYQLTPEDFSDNCAKLSMGKKKHVLIKIG